MNPMPPSVPRLGRRVSLYIYVWVTLTAKDSCKMKSNKQYIAVIY